LVSGVGGGGASANLGKMCENLRKIALCALILQKWHPKSKCRRFFHFFGSHVFFGQVGRDLGKNDADVLWFEKMCPKWNEMQSFLDVISGKFGQNSFAPPKFVFCIYASEWRWTGRSRIADTLSHFARSWHHASRSWGGLPAPVGVLEQWNNNVASSNPIPGELNRRVLRFCLVLQPWASAENFPGGGNGRDFANPFQIADDAVLMDIHKTFLHHKENSPWKHALIGIFFEKIGGIYEFCKWGVISVILYSFFSELAYKPTSLLSWTADNWVWIALGTIHNYVCSH